MNISDRSASAIRKAGLLLLAISAALFIWIYDRFESLPNYQRIAAMVPFAFAIPMTTVESYRSGWSSLGPIQKGRAIVWLFAPVLFVGGSLVWFFVDPSAKG